jgi:hypothetical protein
MKVNNNIKNMNNNHNHNRNHNHNNLSRSCLRNSSYYAYSKKSKICYVITGIII